MALLAPSGYSINYLATDLQSAALTITKQDWMISIAQFYLVTAFACWLGFLKLCSFSKLVIPHLCGRSVL